MHLDEQIALRMARARVDEALRTGAQMRAVRAGRANGRTSSRLTRAVAWLERRLWLAGFAWSRSGSGPGWQEWQWRGSSR
jgi:hypothetical protein